MKMACNSSKNEAMYILLLSYTSLPSVSSLVLCNFCFRYNLKYHVGFMQMPYIGLDPNVGFMQIPHCFLLPIKVLHFPFSLKLYTSFSCVPR